MESESSCAPIPLMERQVGQYLLSNSPDAFLSG